MVSAADIGWKCTLINGSNNGNMQYPLFHSSPKWSFSATDDSPAKVLDRKLVDELLNHRNESSQILEITIHVLFPMFFEPLPFLDCGDASSSAVDQLCENRFGHGQNHDALWFASSQLARLDVHPPKSGRIMAFHRCLYPVSCSDLWENQPCGLGRGPNQSDVETEHKCLG